MPVNMINALVGSRTKVSGSSSATAIAEPRPGRTPTAVPMSAPRNTNSSADGLRTSAKPPSRLVSCSIAQNPPTKPAGSEIPSSMLNTTWTAEDTASPPSAIAGQRRLPRAAATATNSPVADRIQPR